MSTTLPAIPFTIPAYPKPLSLSQARVDLPPEEFRTRLRGQLLSQPHVTLYQVARELGVTRQCVSQLVGPLGRPSCAHPGPRPHPRLDEARRKLPDLIKRVQAGETAESAAATLGVSMYQAIQLGFRTKAIRRPHGKGRAGCNCWRCRNASGIANPRGRKADARQCAAVLDWLAYADPFTNEPLTQMEIGRLANLSQGAVSRIVRGATQ
jgi:predicted transcriptional regulator